MSNIAAIRKLLSVAIAVAGITACGPIETRSEITYNPALFPVSYRLFNQFGQPVPNVDVRIEYPHAESCTRDFVSRSTNANGIVEFPRVVGCDIRLFRIDESEGQMDVLPSSSSDLYEDMEDLEQYWISDGPFSTEVAVRVFEAPPLLYAEPAPDEYDSGRTFEILFADLGWPYAWDDTAYTQIGSSNSPACSTQFVPTRSWFESPPVTVQLDTWNCDGTHSMYLSIEGVKARDAFELTCDSAGNNCQIRP